MCLSKVFIQERCCIKTWSIGFFRSIKSSEAIWNTESLERSSLQEVLFLSSPAIDYLNDLFSYIEVVQSYGITTFEHEQEDWSELFSREYQSSTAETSLSPRFSIVLSRGLDILDILSKLLRLEVCVYVLYILFFLYCLL